MLNAKNGGLVQMIFLFKFQPLIFQGVVNWNKSTPCLVNLLFEPLNTVGEKDKSFKKNQGATSMYM